MLAAGCVAQAHSTDGAARTGFSVVCAELLQRADAAEGRADAAQADAALARQELASVRASPPNDPQTWRRYTAERCMCWSRPGMRVCAAAAEQNNTENLSHVCCNKVYQHASRTGKSCICWCQEYYYALFCGWPSDCKKAYSIDSAAARKQTRKTLTRFARLLHIALTSGLAAGGSRSGR